MLDRRQPDLTVITDFVHKERNLSAILRNCDAVGIGTVHAVLDAETFRAFRGTAAGSHKWVETRPHAAVEEAIDAVRANGYRVYAAHLSDRSRDFREVDYRRPSAIVLGAEKWGASDVALSRVDGEIFIPMFGMTESFNVSVACAIILMEARRQREEAGLYNHPRLSPEEYNRLLVEWGHASIARFCKSRKLDYPRLDSNGEVPPAERERLRQG